MMFMQAHKEGGLVTGRLDGLLSAERGSQPRSSRLRLERIFADAKVSNLPVDKILRAAKEGRSEPTESG